MGKYENFRLWLSSLGMTLVLGGYLLAQDSLVAYYPLNANASDKSGNGHHGTIYGAKSTVDRYGNRNSAYLFDGVNDYIDVPYHPDFYPTSMTATVWVKPDSVDHGVYILTTSGDIKTPPYDPFRLKWKESRRVSARYEGGQDSIHVEFSSKTKLEASEWYFVATTYDEISGRASLYINGLMEKDSTAAMVLDNNTLGLQIGAGQINTGEPDSASYFKGAIDDVKFFNRALSSEQIRKMYEDGVPVGLGDREGTPITGFLLYQNFPNPFNPTTAIRYAIPHSGKVLIKIYSILGQRVRTLVNEFKSAGNHSVVWDGRDDRGNKVVSGVYFYQLNAEGTVLTKKMVLLQ